ncbi:MAG: twin-arginine translocase TatA/TatE family subunit, partial [Planctomycetota bacterium]
MIAFIDSLGWTEMLLLVVIGLLLYGRNLPEAGRSLGRLLAQLKRGFQEFKDQLDRDGEIRDVKKTLRDTTQELRRVAQVPRAMADPGRAVRDFANQTISTPPPDTPDPSAPRVDDEAGVEGGSETSVETGSETGT